MFDARHALLCLAALGLATPARATCLPADIRAALAQADAACGIEIISTFRRGAIIAGTRRPSMHASCRAADFTTRNPACVLRALAGWKGKLSTDYARMRHFHIDNGRYARFAHGGWPRRVKPVREAKVRPVHSVLP